MILLLLAAAAVQPQTETPRQFVERLYASYREPGFSPFKQTKLVFTRRVRAAIEEDSKLFRDEIGYLGGDPICQCQDAAGLHATITAVQLQSRDRAAVNVSISLRGYDARLATLKLVRTSVGWRVADISSADEPSFLLGIEESNRKARAANR